MSKFVKINSLSTYPLIKARLANIEASAEYLIENLWGNEIYIVEKIIKEMRLQTFRILREMGCRK